MRQHLRMCGFKPHTIPTSPFTTFGKHSEVAYDACFPVASKLAQAAKATEPQQGR
jgi:hypothetical protein